jgi:hypothetical protein
MSQSNSSSNSFNPNNIDKKNGKNGKNGKNQKDDKNDKNDKNDKKKLNKKKKNKKRKRDDENEDNNDHPKKKKPEIIYFDDPKDIGKFFDQLFKNGGNGPNEGNNDLHLLDQGYYSDGYDDCTEEEEINIMELLCCKDITLDDLIGWGDLYHQYRRKYCADICLKTLWRIQSPLIKLQKMVGMQNIKTEIIGHILFFLQNLQMSNEDMMHTIVEGPPGVGKTELGKILGELYIKMGILKTDCDIDDPNFNINSMFHVVKRSDLIGKYLGHTAVKTQEAIDKCAGGVMFIDEAYSLGNVENKDIFSKECIDTINRNLTENRNFLCIIAGYANQLEKCFFSYNEGLKRRFPFRYGIEGYSPAELRDIFKGKVSALGWSYDEFSIDLKFFETHMKYFPHFGGDMETLLLNCKIYHGKRVFGRSLHEKKLLTYEDVKGGFDIYVSSRNSKSADNTWKNLF